MRYRIAGHSVHARSSVHLVDAISLAQRSRRDLPRRGFFSRAGRSVGELTARAHAKQSADDPLFSHAEPDERTKV